MEQAKLIGPRMIHEQKRMVTLADYTYGLEIHPLIRRAAAKSRWTGSWITVTVAVVLRWENVRLDDEAILDTESEFNELKNAVDRFYVQRGIDAVEWNFKPTYRSIIESYIAAYRMAGREVVLIDAVPVGIDMTIEIEVKTNYFQSEVRNAVHLALGTGPAGFFEYGRLRFGEDLHASDIYQVLFDLDGVEDVRITRFKRSGNQYIDMSVNGHICLEGLEIAICDNDLRKPERGEYRILLHGGRKG
jgi:hypothetical protein